MRDKWKELDNIFAKANKYKDEDDIPMKLDEKQQRKIMKNIKNILPKNDRSKLVNCNGDDFFNKNKKEGE